MILEPKTSIETSTEKKEERRFLGTGIQKRGLKLFAMDASGNVLEIKMQDKKTVDFVGAKKGKKMAFINPNNKFVWALNQKNAERKFKKNN